MNWAKLVIAIALIATAWWATRDRTAPEKAPPSGQIDAPPSATSPRTPSALPDPDVARLRAVRSAIANTPEGHKLGYEFGEKVTRVANSLSDEELLAAIDLLDEVGFTIEELCLAEGCPLERQIALLNRFGHREDQGIADAILDTAYEFARKDPAATRRWLRQFEPGVGPGQGLEAVFTHLDKTDPAASIAMLRDLDDHEAENLIGYGDGPNLSHLTGRQRLALMQTLSSDKLREFNLRQTVVWYLTEDDPEDALNYIRELPPGERHATHGRHLIQVMARQEGADFPAILTRMENDLPAEVRSNESFYVLAAEWQQDAPAAARAWIATLPPGRERDAAISGCASEAAAGQLHATYELIVTMASPAEAQKITGNLLRRWSVLDPEGAADALPDANISESDRRSIERNLKTDG